MEFSNVITINDIINTIILIFYGVTILLTYLTLKEMKNQRNISVLPNIFIKYDSNITYNIKKIKSSTEKFDIFIQNNGNGDPRNIKYAFKILDLENKNFDNVNFINNAIFYNFKDYIGCQPSNAVSNEGFIQVLQKGEKISIDTRGIEHSIQCIVKSIIESHSENMSITETMEEWNKLKLKLLLNIDYEDVIGNERSVKFWLILEPAFIDYEKGNIDYILKLDKIN